LAQAAAYGGGSPHPSVRNRCHSRSIEHAQHPLTHGPRETRESFQLNRPGSSVGSTGAAKPLRSDRPKWRYVGGADGSTSSKRGSKTSVDGTGSGFILQLIVKKTRGDVWTSAVGRVR
jgi:hypothetical protein